MTWKTKLFDAKIATSDKFKFNGLDSGDTWKRSIYGFFVGQCPLVATMLDWAEKRIMEPITMDMYQTMEQAGEFGDLMGESAEVLAGHIWSFLQMCCTDAAATMFQACKPRLNGLEIWRALTWEINAGRGSRLGSLQAFVAQPPSIKMYQDVSGALSFKTWWMQEGRGRET